MNRDGPFHLTLGRLMLCLLAGAVATAAFARVVSLSWARWQRQFQNQADEAAVLAGGLVFIFSTLLTFHVTGSFRVKSLA